MARVRVWRDEIEDGILPALCIRCGDPDVRWRARRFTWSPPWLIVVLLAGLLACVITPLFLAVGVAVNAALALATFKHMRFDVPVCERHAGHWAWRQWFTYAGLAAWFVIGATGAVVFLSENHRRGALYEAGTTLASVGGFGGLLWLIASAAVQQAAIRATEITDDRITLVHTSREFADALEDAQDEAEDERERRRERRGRRGGLPLARRADDFDDDD